MGDGREQEREPTAGERIAGTVRDQVPGWRGLAAAVDVELARAQKLADGWRDYADSLRCPACTHPRGPLGRPAGLEGARCVWVCPCDCHADVPALRERIRQLEAALAEFRNAWETATCGFDGLSPTSADNLEAASELAALLLAPPKKELTQPAAGA